MSAIYPTLPGKTFGTVKSPTFSTNVQTANGGSETRIENWPWPRWKIKLVYNFLRDTAAANEFRTLLGFFLQMKGAAKSFLFVDPDDYVASGQTIAVGDGSTRGFTMVRTFGGFVEPVWAITALTAVYLDGVPTAAYSLSGNTLTMNAAPGNGVVLAADFTFAFVVRFQDDHVDPEKFAYRLWSLGEVNLYSLFEVIT